MCFKLDLCFKVATYCESICGRCNSNFLSLSLSLGLFLLGAVAFFTGHSDARFVRWLAPLTSLDSTLLCLRLLGSLARFVHRLVIHFAHSLMRQWKFLNMCLRCQRVKREQSRFLLSVKTHFWRVSSDDKNAFPPVKRDNSVNTYSRISTVPQGSERSE